MPGYIKNLPQLRAKGVDIVAVVAFNDPFVMSAWGKANEVRGDEIVSIPAPRECLMQLLTTFLGTAVPLRSRCPVLQEHWLG
jgi:peroxiredoxin